MAIFRPGKPWTRLSLTSPATQAAGAQIVLWDAETGDGDYTWPGANNGEWFCDLAGLYRVTFALARDAVAVSSAASGRLLHNGTTVVGAQHPASTATIDLNMTYVNQLAAGDKITAQANLHASATAGFAETRTWLFLVREGPVRYTS